MKTTTIIFLIVIMLILTGCDADHALMIDCTPPLIQKGQSCCMDADRNGICDIDEKEETTTEQIDEVQEELQDNVMEETGTEETTEEQETKLEVGTKEEAEKVAKIFATSWNEKQYNFMHPLFTQDLKSAKTITEFKAIMELDSFYKKIKEVEFLNVNMIDDNTAELNIEFHTNVQDIMLNDATLEFSNGEWKVKAFSDIFELDLYDAACISYKQNNQYKMSDCAYDLAKKVNDPTYCELSECHYLECLKDLEQPAGMTQEAEQCYKCQPVMKTTNDCILDTAKKYDKISICGVIDEDHYSDKYCFCYGGFAQHKGNSGYCNMIESEEHKKLCLKGFEGKYC